MPGYVIPDALIKEGTELTLGYYDGSVLVLCASGGALRKPLILSAHFEIGGRVPDRMPRIVTLDKLPLRYEALIELNVSEIARKVADLCLPD